MTTTSLCPPQNVKSYLLDVEVSHEIALAYLCCLGGLLLDPLGEQFDGRALGAVHLQLGHPELPEVGPRVAGQRLAVLELKPTQLTEGG